MPLNRLTPKKGYSVVENIAYGLRARQRLDIFTAETPREQRPLIVFVHGGAWLHGDKKITALLVKPLQKRAMTLR